MFTLANTDLQVELLDPVADVARLGTRYCTGGSIFQVTDARHGPLLTGPTYPESFNPRDGQGIPDAFSHRPLQDPAAGGTTALIIGVGTCDLAAKQVLAFCSWEVERHPSSIVLRTEQTWQDYALKLERAVALSGRTVTSRARVRNTGGRTLPICWFPHPFFPQPETPELCRINVPVHMAENPGYTVAESGFIARKAWPSPEGFYQALDHAAQTPVTVLQRHPKVGIVAGTCSYVPSLFPIWGNAHTFSWEPFFERTLAPGQEADWGIAYDF